MPNHYIVWSHSEIYTNFGMAEAWMMKQDYDIKGKFDYNVILPGIYNAQSHDDKPISISTFTTPSSKVVKMTYRQNSVQGPRTALYNPLSIFWRVDDVRVRARDLKYGDVLASVFGEVTVIDSELVDYESSVWYLLTTEGFSPNIGLNILLTFPIDFADLEKFETEMAERRLLESEYSSDPELTTPSGIEQLNPMNFNLEKVPEVCEKDKMDYEFCRA